MPIVGVKPIDKTLYQFHINSGYNKFIDVTVSSNGTYNVYYIKDGTYISNIGKIVKVVIDSVHGANSYLILDYSFDNSHKKERINLYKIQNIVDVTPSNSYQVAIENGFIGTVTEWLESLKGDSAYEVAVENGFEGTEEEWLKSLCAPSNYQIAIDNGFEGTEEEWLETLKALSNYEIAVKNGFNGTEEEWLESLRALSNYEIAVKNGFEGTEQEWLNSLKALSNYQLAVQEGFVGSVSDYLESIKGTSGKDGSNGVTFTPTVSEDGTISWTNDGELDNPESVNIRGPIGPNGKEGLKGNDGFSPTIDVEDIDGGHQVTITDVNGSKTFNVMDGSNTGGSQGSSSLSGNPIGTIISFMGKATPDNYLICDGAEYNIKEYPELAAFFLKEFGEKNHFGGDGTTTFAVPDMRNLFLRGYHGEAEEKLSGEIGAKQSGTQHPTVFQAATGDFQAAIAVINDKKETVLPENVEDYQEKNDSWGRFGIVPNNFATYNHQSVVGGKSLGKRYTARPANMAVLYCIKAKGGTSAIEEYDTEDGWYVRKWPDGYMEQTLKKEIHNAIVSTSWGSSYNTGTDYGPYKYPEAFSKLYGVNISATGNTSLLVTGCYGNYETSCLIETPLVGIYRPMPAERINIHFFITAKGRWK